MFIFVLCLMIEHVICAIPSLEPLHAAYQSIPFAGLVGLLYNLMFTNGQPAPATYLAALLTLRRGLHELHIFETY